MKNNFLKSFMVLCGGISISPSTNQLHKLSLKDSRFRQVKPLMKKQRKNKEKASRQNKDKKIDV